jgi:uncharacterized membrane protein
VSHVLATLVFLGGLAGSAWLSWRGRPSEGVAALVMTVLAVCAIGSAGVRGGKDEGPEDRL